MSSVPKIPCSDRVKDRVKEIRDENDHTSYDSALREILRDAGYDV